MWRLSTMNMVRKTKAAAHAAVSEILDVHDSQGF
jgi:hypothetical protein